MTKPVNNASFIDMTCSNCGAPLQLDVDNLQKYCEHCGGKILVDPEVFREVLLEREKTKQAHFQLEAVRLDAEQEYREWAAKEQRHTTRNTLTTILMVVGVVVFAAGGILGELDGPDSIWYLVAFVGMVAFAVGGILALITLVTSWLQRKQ